MVLINLLWDLKDYARLGDTDDLKKTFEDVKYCSELTCVINECLIIASKAGHFDIVKFIVSKRLNTSWKDAINTSTKNEHLDIAEYLKESKLSR